MTPVTCPISTTDFWLWWIVFGLVLALVWIGNGRVFKIRRESDDDKKEKDGRSH